jgi:hypothetical protein
VLGALTVPLTAPLLGFVRPDALPAKKAAFEEVGNSVLMSMSVPWLFRRHDDEAFASIDSGFDTTLQFTLRVWKFGTRQLVSTGTRTVRIRRDIWKKSYVVGSREAHGWTKRYFDDREAALAAAVKLDRIKICSASALERGEGGPYYFVEVLALRNPLERREGTRARSGTGRGQGRDLEWFGRLVHVLAGERVEAEEVVRIRTNPFYLVPR